MRTLGKFFITVICLTIIAAIVLVCVNVKPHNSLGSVVGDAIDGTIEDVRFALNLAEHYKDKIVFDIYTKSGLWIDAISEFADNVWKSLSGGK